MPFDTPATFVAFGRNSYARSSDLSYFEHYTVAASSVPGDGTTQNNKVLQTGTVMAKITSGGDSGKIGPFNANVADGRQTAANIVGVCDTFLPFQLNYGDREVAVVKQGRVIGAQCYEYKTGTVTSPGDYGLQAGTKTALATRGADLDIAVV